MNDGYTFEEIAKILLLDDSSVRRYYEIYAEKNLKGLLETNYLGRSSYLSKKQLGKLKRHLKKYIYPDTKSIIEYIKETFNVTYTPKGIVPLLHRLGFVYKKTKRVPGKANPEEQKKFLNETYKEIKEIKGENKDKRQHIGPERNAIEIDGPKRRGDQKRADGFTSRTGW